MQNIIIYPYDDTIYQIVRNANSKDYILSGIISPKGWGFCEDEIIYNKNRKIKVVDCIDKVEFPYDSLCFVNSYNELDFRDFFVPMLQECQKRKLDVYVYREFTEEELDIIKSYIPSNKLFVKYNNTEYGVEDECLYDLKVPIIIITDSLPTMKSQDIQLNLLKELQKRGYKVKLVTKDNNLLMLDEVVSIPSYVLDTKQDSRNKIVMLNHYIKSLEKDLDAILINIPGNIIEVSKHVLGDFGYKLFLFLRGIEPDYIVCNLPYINDVKEQYNSIVSCIQNKLSYEVDAFNIMPQHFDLLESEVLGRMSYTTLPAEYVYKILEKERRAYCLCDEKDVYRLVDDIVHKLSRYAQSESIYI